jgi:cytochrome c553
LLRLLPLVVAVLACAPAARAADAAAGQAKAQMCAVCHGPIGMAVASETLNLAGQPPGYLTSQPRHYRDGSRKHEVMSIMAKTLTNIDIDIDNLAAWFASIRVEAIAPGANWRARAGRVLPACRTGGADVQPRPKGLADHFGAADFKDEAICRSRLKCVHKIATATPNLGISRAWPLESAS